MSMSVIFAPLPQKALAITLTQRDCPVPACPAKHKVPTKYKMSKTNQQIILPSHCCTYQTLLHCHPLKEPGASSSARKLLKQY